MSSPVHTTGWIDERAWQRMVSAAARSTGWLVVEASVLRSDPGWPDLTLAHPVGHLIFAELKTDVGRVSATQARVHAALVASGQAVYVWRPRDLPAVREILVAPVLAGVLPEPWASPPAVAVTGRLTLEGIADVVAAEYGVTVARLRSPDRSADVAWPRHVMAWLARRAGWGLVAIGQFLGRCHNTVIYATRRVDEVIAAGDGAAVLSLEAHLGVASPE